MESMEENEVWDLEELPVDRKAISCRWVLRKKRDGKYKARLVARGFMQKEGVDYFETFSPVISMPALRLLLIIMLNENSNVLVLDVKTAFLNGELNETIYMDQQKGYDDNTGRKCKLKKSLYGLKQAPRQWHQKFLNFVNKLGFKQLNSESCIFIRQVNSKKFFMALYVDDLLLGGSDVQEINVIVDMLSKEFKMSKSEKASEFLGIRIEFISDNLFFDQESYILRLLKKYKMLDCNPSSIPIETKATAATFEKSNHFNGPYRELVGSLLYLAYVSRPVILFAVNCLSQLQEHPTDAAWCALKKILRYLKEAEIIALSKGVQDLLWIKGITSEIVCVKNLIVYEDNQSCIKCIANENNFGRMKHVDIKLKFIRDIVSRNKIKIEYISTGNQIVDMLTKALPKTKFCELLKLCNFKI
ncbi:Retrovirus-related Pol polyprotein from transposon TNT 1-94 [Araneus ventricosus]|uniref:Retrovirus-related Pol polyprotein from transposon TNT 1-94 n=1 Tax=Araneus ventricosus TaxID=182803 RepID=A0A4Y2M0S2_ARAVE|nr:Retrovirus-related Pol polyprotein from transposon TNT 1-94 [Araneus ventricosus]